MTKNGERYPAVVSERLENPARPSTETTSEWEFFVRYGYMAALADFCCDLTESRLPFQIDEEFF